LTIRSHCSKPDSELKFALRQRDRFTKVELVPRRYGGVAEDYLDVYLRTPDLPKDDIARALVARGRARKGAGQRLLLMASRGLSHPFVVLISYFADRIPPPVIDSPLRRLPDRIDLRPFKPRAPVLLASGARCSSFVLNIKREPLSFSI
jgi:hypothetical protein